MMVGGGGTVMYIGGMPYSNQADQFDTFSTKVINESHSS